MNSLTGSYLFDVVSVLTAISAIVITTLKWFHSYWRRRGVPTRPIHFLFGHAKTLLTQEESFSDYFAAHYNYLKSRGHPHGGLYMLTMPAYLPVDIKIIKNMLLNDFDHFVDRGVYFNEEQDPLSAHLFSLEGTKWRNLRVKLTPTFTSGKMKMMFDIVVNCSNELVEEMEKGLEKQPLDVKDILGRYTADVIGRCAFGIDCNSLKDPNDEFTKHFKLFFNDSLSENLIQFVSFIMPSLMKKLGTKAVKPRLAKFFMKVVKDTVEYREKNNIHRKDFMHLLLQLKNRGKIVEGGGILRERHEINKEVTLTFNELAAQAFVFFLAGYETSSTTLTFCLYELALNPEVQAKLRKEITDVISKHKGQVTYDSVMEMKYMDAIVNETLRKYPPAALLQRICTKEYNVPGTNVVIEKGVIVNIPIYSIHHDADYYPDPEKFDPDRFLEEEIRKRPQYTFLPFGEGPRICIGLRFGLMQIKIGLCALLKNYNFTVSPKTTIPLKMDPQSIILSSVGGIWLNYSKV